MYYVLEVRRINIREVLLTLSLTIIGLNISQNWIFHRFSHFIKSLNENVRFCIFAKIDCDITVSGESFRKNAQMLTFPS
jgi:hypothetical protein